ncbi:MAG: hypothetical protein ACHQFW_03745 [Chitinophagales bacterium]
MDFSEKQQFNKVFVFIITLFVFGSIAVGVGVGISQSSEMANEQFLWITITAGLIIFFALFFFIFKAELEIGVDRYGFSFKYFPFVPKLVQLDFNEMESWRIAERKLISLKTKSGYNKDIFRKRTSIVLGGRDYIEMIMKNGKTYIFSTKDNYGLSSVMRKFAAAKELNN